MAGAAALVVVLQFWGLYAPRVPGGDLRFPGADKLLHAVGFALPVVLVTLADALHRRAAGRPPRARVLVLVVWLSVAHAVVSELVQGAFYANRAGDPLDVLADWSGIAVGGLLVGMWVALRQAGRSRRAGAAAEEPGLG